jgi:hypothetical protein
MFYVKNVPTWERVLRVVAGVLAVWAAFQLAGGVAGIVLAASAAGIVVSGLLGFCPMCALVGRKLDRQAGRATR